MRDSEMGQKDWLERRTLRRYLRNEGAIVGNVGYPALPRFSGLVRRLLPPSIAPAARRAGTRACRFAARRRIADARRRSPLNLHLASGRFYKPGWVNIDLLGAPVDIAWDLSDGIPFRSGSVDAVFHEHLLEHLTLEQGWRLLAECFRVLKRGGVLRIGVPDAGAYLRSYAGDAGFIESTRPGRPTALLAVQEVFYRHGHKTMYDTDTLHFVCRAAGFFEVCTSAFGQGRIQPSPDGEHRRRETCYVEAIKP